MKKEQLIFIGTKEFRLIVFSLVGGEVYESGYYIDYIDLNTMQSRSGEVFDDDHVWRELKDIGVKKIYRKLVLKHL